MPSPSQSLTASSVTPRESGKSFGERERAVGLLQIEGQLAAVRFGHQQVRQAVAVDIGPQDAAVGLGGFG